MEVPIDIEVVTPPPADAPDNFRELLALGLRTTDARLLDAAERGYQGTYPRLKDFLMERIGRTLGPVASALLELRDAAELQRSYQGNDRLVWSIALTDKRCMVFELPRTSSRCAAIAALVEPPRVEAANDDARMVS